VKSVTAVYQADRVFRFYDCCAAERSLRQLLHGPSWLVGRLVV